MYTMIIQYPTLLNNNEKSATNPHDDLRRDE